jgi:hypothetical protein
MTDLTHVEVMDKCQRFVGTLLPELCRNVITLKLTNKVDYASTLYTLIQMLRPVTQHHALPLAESMIAYAAMEAQTKPIRVW